MISYLFHSSGRLRHTLGFVFLLSCFLVYTTGAQPQYRTFSQDDLASKKANAGKIYESKACFTFKNTGPNTVSILRIKFNANVLSIDDSGGYPNATVSGHGKELELSGKPVGTNDSVTICITSSKKAPGTMATEWKWILNGQTEGGRHKNLSAFPDVQVPTEPNGGNIREFLYKKVITRPAGVVVGIAKPDSANLYGWIRYKTADAKYFPHIGAARCFDFIATGPGKQKPFLNELKNPHVKKHDNHLLGELHALKLACIANDSGVTEPIGGGATLFSSLIYNDTVNLADPCNGRTIREIVYLADSALTYCALFAPGDYTALDACISRINAAFGGPYVAESFSPFIVAGTHSLDEVYFLHPNPAATPATSPVSRFSIFDIEPEHYALAQNYPNPFNPTTTIEFALPYTSMITLQVYNMLGQLVATLADRQPMEEGSQSIDFDASQLPSGVYLYRISAEQITDDGTPGQHFATVKKMVLMK